MLWSSNYLKTFHYLQSSSHPPPPPLLGQSSFRGMRIQKTKCVCVARRLELFTALQSLHFSCFKQTRYRNPSYSVYSFLRCDHRGQKLEDRSWTAGVALLIWLEERGSVMICTVYGSCKRTCRTGCWNIAFCTSPVSNHTWLARSGL